MKAKTLALSITLGIFVFFTLFMFLVVITKGLAMIALVLLGMFYCLYDFILSCIKDSRAATIKEKEKFENWEE